MPGKRKKSTEDLRENAKKYQKFHYGRMQREHTPKKGVLVEAGQENIQPPTKVNTYKFTSPVNPESSKKLVRTSPNGTKTTLQEAITINSYKKLLFSPTKASAKKKKRRRKSIHEHLKENTLDPKYDELAEKLRQLLIKYKKCTLDVFTADTIEAAKKIKFEWTTQNPNFLPHKKFLLLLLGDKFKLLTSAKISNNGKVATKLKKALENKKNIEAILKLTLKPKDYSKYVEQYRKKQMFIDFFPNKDNSEMLITKELLEKRKKIPRKSQISNNRVFKQSAKEYIQSLADSINQKFPEFFDLAEFLRYSAEHSKIEWLHRIGFSLANPKMNPQTEENLNAGLAWANTKDMISEGISKAICEQGKSIYIKPETFLVSFHSKEETIETKLIGSTKYKILNESKKILTQKDTNMLSKVKLTCAAEIGLIAEALQSPKKKGLKK